MKKWVMFIGVFLIVFVVVASQSKEIGAFYMNNFHNFNESSMNINFNDEDKKFEKTGVVHFKTIDRGEYTNIDINT